MKSNRERPVQPLQAILSRKNLEITCTLVFEDESLSGQPVVSLSLRGAQREITGRLVALGFVPAGRWSAEEEPDEDGYREWTRGFRPGPEATPELYEQLRGTRAPGTIA
jgi:hypothetical protein